MGKVTGFMEYTREAAAAAARRGARQRLVRDLPAVPRGKGPRRRARAAWIAACPFCHTGCPLNNIIPDWNDLVYRGRWQEAIRVLHATNNFPEFTGRICPAPCEAACVLGINEPPVTIKLIEKTIIDRAFARRLDQARAARTSAPASASRSSARDPPGWPPRSSSPAPATTSPCSRRADRIGGLLRYGIPDFQDGEAAHRPPHRADDAPRA